MNPVVNVICTTYNQEKYIRKTLESLVCQKTNFHFEIIINDDASTDGNPDIIKEFEMKYPSIIKPTYQPVNQHSKLINVWFDVTFPKAKAKYIALCEGDDYWTDDTKLQQQYDFMEANPEYSCVFNNSIIVDENDNYISDFNKYKPINPIPEKDIISKGGNLSITASMFFRNQTEYPKFLFKAKSGDRALRLYLMTMGKFHFIDKKMSAYRKHDNGVTNGGNVKIRIEFIKSNIELLNLFNNWSNLTYNKLIKKEISNMYRNLSIFENNFSLKLKSFKLMNIKDKIKRILRVMYKFSLN